jgi:NodT family efflux transporter outer membrane factor (OMF) lipoprotein
MLAALLTGCMVGPDFSTPVSRLQNSYDAPAESEFTDGTKVDLEHAIDPVAWWGSFKDPVLLRLLEKSAQQNLSLQAAAVQVYQARAQLGITDATLLPTVNATGSATQANQASLAAQSLNTSNLSTTTALALQASWELDFWGKLRRGVESSVAGYMSSASAYYSAQTSLASSVASTYITIQNYNQLIDVSKRNLALQFESLLIAKVRYQYGETSLLDLSQAQSQYEQTKSQIPILIASLRQNETAISVLLGEAPDFYTKQFGQSHASLSAPPLLQVAIPKELLRRRPDVRQAEFAAAAQSALIGVNTAALYPSFSLSGVFGFQSVNYGGVTGSPLFSWDNKVVSGGGAFSFPIFYRGAIVEQIRVQDAVFQQSVLSYQNLVLQAQKEVDDALMTISTTRSSADALARAVTAAQNAARLAQERYKAGQADYNTVILAQQQLLSVESSFVQTSNNNLLGYVTAFKALGGGWSGELNLPQLTTTLSSEMKQRTDWGNALDGKADPRLMKSSEMIQ